MSFGKEGRACAWEHRESAYSRFTQGRKGLFGLYSDNVKDLALLAFTLMDHSV